MVKVPQDMVNVSHGMEMSLDMMKLSQDMVKKINGHDTSLLGHDK
jgi:hypothetical protein